jgi:hypothetical protein
VGGTVAGELAGGAGMSATGGAAGGAGMSATGGAAGGGGGVVDTGLDGVVGAGVTTAVDLGPAWREIACVVAPARTGASSERGAHADTVGKCLGGAACGDRCG